MTSLGRNPGLDIVRSVAIICVLVFHSNARFFSSFSKNLYVNVVNNFTGLYGVDLFFVLSGFLIGQIIISNFILDKNGSNKKKLFNFYIRRWFRTLPLYYLFLFINIFLFAISPLLKLLLVNINYLSLIKIPELIVLSINYFSARVNNLWEYFFFLQGTDNQLFHFMHESWSLCVEEWFYLTFPLFVLVLKSRYKNFNHKTLIYLCLTIIFISTINRYIAFSLYDFSYFFTIIFRYDAIATGILLACIYKFYPKLFQFLSNKVFFILAVLGLILCINWILYIGELKAMSPPYEYLKTLKGDFFSSVFLVNVTEICSAIIICFFTTLKVNHISFFTFTSKISYSLYLTHLPVLTIITLSIIYFDSIRNIWIALALFYSLTIAISYTLYKFYEKPIMNLRDSKRIRNIF